MRMFWSLPYLFLTSSVVVAVQGDPALTYKGNNGWPRDAFPLGNCQGDCDNDNDCQVCRTHNCFQISHRLLWNIAHIIINPNNTFLHRVILSAIKDRLIKMSLDVPDQMPTKVKTSATNSNRHLFATAS